MAVVEQLIKAESDGTVSFGNYKLPEKKKLENFEHNGNILKVKTYKDITKLPELLSQVSKRQITGWSSA